MKRLFDTESEDEKLSESQELLLKPLRIVDERVGFSKAINWGIDPTLYPKESDFTLNISLKYSILENVINIDIVKCDLENEKKKLLYSKITLLRNGEEIKNKKTKARQEKENIDFSKDHKFELKEDNVMDFELRVQIKKETSITQKSESKRVSKIFSKYSIL